MAPPQKTNKQQAKTKQNKESLLPSSLHINSTNTQARSVCVCTCISLPLSSMAWFFTTEANLAFLFSFIFVVVVFFSLAHFPYSEPYRKLRNPPFEGPRWFAITYPIFPLMFTKSKSSRGSFVSPMLLWKISS